MNKLTFYTSALRRCDFSPLTLGQIKWKRLTADNINLFKKRLDKFWLLNYFIYLYRAQQLKTGSVN